MKKKALFLLLDPEIIRRAKEEAVQREMFLYQFISYAILYTINDQKFKTLKGEENDG